MTGTNDKLRSLFLAMLMVVSVFGATVAFSGTAAAAANTPDISSVSEHEGEISIDFNTSIDDSSIDTTDLVVVRSAGTPSNETYDATVSSQQSGTTVNIDPAGDDWNDLNPADEVYLDLGEVDSSTGQTYDFGDVEVSPSVTQFVDGGTQFNSPGEAARVYEDSTVLFTSDMQDENLLVRNTDTGTVLLDGSTGVNSQNVTWDTDDLTIDDTYEVVFSPDDSTNRDKRYFNVSDLGLSAESDASDSYAHDDDVEFTVSGDAIRGNADVAIMVSGPDDFGTAYARTSYNNLAEFSQDFDLGEIAAGDYSITVTDVETGVEADAGSFTVDPAPDRAGADSADFTSGVVSDTRGDIVRIPIEFSGVDDDADLGPRATISIGSLSEVNYVTNVTVTDANQDGEVTLLFNSYAAGTGNMSAIFDTADDGDTVDSMRNESGDFIEDLRTQYGDGDLDAAEDYDEVKAIAAGATLDVANYDLQVAAHADGEEKLVNFTKDTDESIGVDEIDDFGTMSLNPRTTESSSVSVAPADADDEIDLDYVQNSEDLTESSIVATDEVVVHEIVASGFEGAINLLNVTDSAAPDEAFVELADSGLWSATFSQVDDEPNANRPMFYVSDGGNETDLNSDEVNIFTDFDQNAFYVALDVEEIGYDDPNLQDNELWNASFTVEEHEAIGEVLGGRTGGTLQTDWTFRDAKAPLQTNADDQIIVRDQSGQVIRSASGVTVAPGTDLTLFVDASDLDVSPFTEELEATVTSDRTFRFEADLSDKGTGNFTAELSRDSTSLADSAVTEYDGEIRGLPQASVSISDQMVAETNQQVTVDSATLSEGGFVVIHDEDGAVVGSSKYLGGGTEHTDVRITLDEDVSSGSEIVAMAHLDTNSNNVYEFEAGAEDPLDVPYTSDGSPVTDSATATVDRAPADFEVSGLSPADVTVDQGDVISSVEATIENTGESEGTQTVEFRVGDTVLGSSEETLAAGDSTTVTFEDIDTSSLSPGSYTHGVHTEDDSQTAILTVDAVEPANFEVSGLSPTDVSVTQGDVIGQVEATIENTGESEGTQTVEFRVGDTALASSEVTLAAGDSTTVTFQNIDTSDLSPGAYTHGVFSEDDSATAALGVDEAPTATATPTASPTASATPTASPTASATPTASPTATATPDEGTDTDTDTPTDSGDGGPGFGIGIAIVALLAAALIGARRRE